jgi:putative aminopeptidase FrvX
MPLRYITPVIDRQFLSALTEAPSIGTACYPVIKILKGRMHGFACTEVPDGFAMFQREGARPEEIRAVLVAHMDEIGGIAYGPAEDGWFNARFWGNKPETYRNTPLQGFDYLGGEPFSIEARQVDEERLMVRGEGVRPYRTGWTFKETTTYDGDIIEGKALDPRVTLYAVIEAVRTLNRPDVAAICVMAEECAMDVARKAVTFLDRNCPRLNLVVNADVPWIENIGEGRLDLPAIRIFEGRNFIDPTFGIALADRLAAQGVEFHLSSARSGSQTVLFTPLAPTVSVALPSDGVHLPRVRMSLTGLERCQKLLQELVCEVITTVRRGPARR